MGMAAIFYFSSWAFLQAAPEKEEAAVEKSETTGADEGEIHPVYGKPLDVTTDKSGNVASTYKNPKGGYTILVKDRYGKPVSQHTFGAPEESTPMKTIAPEKGDEMSNLAPSPGSHPVIRPTPLEEEKPKKQEDEDF